MSTFGRNRFGSGWVRVSFSHFGPGSCHVIVSGQTLPTLIVAVLSLLRMESNSICIDALCQKYCCGGLPNIKIVGSIFITSGSLSVEISKASNH